MLSWPESGHPVRQRAQPALISWDELLRRWFALRAQADRMSDALRHLSAVKAFRSDEMFTPREPPGTRGYWLEAPIARSSFDAGLGPY